MNNLLVQQLLFVPKSRNVFIGNRVCGIINSRLKLYGGRNKESESICLGNGAIGRKGCRKMG